MMKKIKIHEIQKGMYVVLPEKCSSNSVLKKEFLIKSEAQITKMIQTGIKEVEINLEKSKHQSPHEQPCATKVLPAGRKIRKKASIIPDEFLECLKDIKMPPDKRATLVHQHSIVMMKSLMDDPSVENIIQAKKGIAEIVDLILKDDETNKYMLNITAHDYNTYVHCVNVGVLGISIAKMMFANSTGHDMHNLGAAFFLHDLGKVNIDSAILNKPVVLTDAEMSLMRKHPEFGYEILTKANQLTEECRTIVLHHHERNDGSGYPFGLRGEDIHLYGHLCALADVFDALNSDRPYRNGLGPFAALRVMKEEMQDHFQKDLFEKFVLLFS